VKDAAEGQNDYNMSGLLSNATFIDKAVYYSGCITQALVSFKKYMPPSSSLLQGKHLPFSPSPLRLNIFRLFVILSLTQLYRYTPEIFLRDGIVTHGWSREFRMHMKNPAQTGSGVSVSMTEK
jgi:hypothetical protein